MKTEEGECFYCKRKTNVRQEEVADWISRYVCWECDLKRLFNMKITSTWLIGVIMVFFILLISLLPKLLN